MPRRPYETQGEIRNEVHSHFRSAAADPGTRRHEDSSTAAQRGRCRGTEGRDRL